MRDLVRSAALVMTAVAFIQVAPADAQNACIPTVVAPPEPGFKLVPVHAGLDPRTGFGPSPPPGANIQLRNTATGAVTRLPWSTWEWDRIVLPVPGTVPNGTYDVTLNEATGSTHHAYVFPNCVAVNRPDFHALVGEPVAVARPSLSLAQTPDQVCDRTATIRLTGIGFTPGTEQPVAGSWRGEPASFEPMSRRWHRGATMVELGTDDPRGADFYTAWIQSLRIYNARTMELTIQICYILENGVKARIWFHDGSQRPWVPITLADRRYYMYRP